MGMKAEGEGKALGSLQGLDGKFRAGLMQASHMAGQLLVRTSQQGILSGGKSGRVYDHPKAGTYQASAPGEYPANVTGANLRSIGYEVPSDRYFWFGAGAPHSGYLEGGTSKMAPRPMLGNAVRDAGDQVTNLLGQVTYRVMFGG